MSTQTVTTAKVRVSPYKHNTTQTQNHLVVFFYFSLAFRDGYWRGIIADRPFAKFQIGHVVAILNWSGNNALRTCPNFPS